MREDSGGGDREDAEPVLIAPSESMDRTSFGSMSVSVG